MEYCQFKWDTVLHFTSLTELYCYQNQLTGLPTLPNTLERLNCSDNLITSLPILPNSIQIINCANNLLTSLPTLPIALTILASAGNQLTSLPNLPSTLGTLYTENNQLLTLPSLPDGMITLYCHNNNIKCFPLFPNSLSGINLDPNPYDCLPNHISAMNYSQWATPICAPGNTNGCITGIEESVNFNNKISVYPNPIDESGIIEFSNPKKENCTLTLYTPQGKIVQTITDIIKTV